MKSKASFFNLKRPFISTALLRENMKKLWPICLLLTLMYVISTAFAFLIGNKDDLLMYVESMLANGNSIYWIGLVVFPIVASILVFRYLHSQSGTTVLHSMPLTKSTLFFTNYLSGALMLIVPLLINTAFLAPAVIYAKKKTQLANSGVYTQTFDNLPFEDLSLAHVGNWLAVALLISIFIYTLAVLAAIVSGNTALHMLITLLLNFAPVYLFFIAGSYLDAELLGFSFSDFVRNNSKWFSPLFNSNGVVGVEQWILFVIVIIIAFFLANILYGKRKLEKSGEPLVFEFLSPIAVFLLALMMTSLSGTYIYFFNGKTGVMFYAGFAAASIVTLIIANMIVQKSPRILNKKTLINFVAYGLIVGIFMLSVSFDVLGLEKKVPETSKVKSVKMNAPVLANKPYKDSSDTFDNYFVNKSYTFESPEAIKYITAFHKDMVNDPDIVSGKGYDTFGYDNQWLLNLDYELDSGNLQREYDVSKVDFKKNENLMKLIETKEYKEKLLLQTLGYDRIEGISFIIGHVRDIKETGISEESGVEEMTYEYEVDSYQLYLHGDERTEFLECLDKDFMEQTAEELMSTERPITNLTMVVDPIKEMKKDYDEYEQSINYVISKSYDHSIKWLKDHGYYDKLVYTADDIEKINVDVIEDDKVINRYTVTDPEEIGELFSKGRVSINGAYEYAVLEIFYTKEAKRRVTSLETYGGSSGEAYGRTNLEENLVYENPMNRYYIRSTQKAYKDLIKKN